MALQKVPLAIPFSTSVDTLTDPKQVMPMHMLSLVNGVYTKDKRVDKRNGFGDLTPVPTDAGITTLATFNSSLSAIGNRLYAFSDPTDSWINHGRFQSVRLSTQPIVRSSLGQSAQDVAINQGLACAVFLDSDGVYKYQVVDASTGQILVATTAILANCVLARVFSLGNYFVITFYTSGAVLQYKAIPLGNITNISSAVTISSSVESVTAGYDGLVYANRLYLAWSGGDMGGAIRISTLDAQLNQSSTVTKTGHTAARISLAVDSSGASPVIWMTFYETSGTKIYNIAVNAALVTLLTFTDTGTYTTTGLTSRATGGQVTVYIQVSNTYGYSSVRTDYIVKKTVTIAGVVSSPTTILRGVAIGSKAFTIDSTDYMLAIYSSVLQPTYFLMDGSGNVVSRFASANAKGYPTTQVLPQAAVDGSVVQIGYLFKDLLEPASIANNVTPGSNIYTQTGVNLITLDLSSQNLITAEMGDNLHIAGGFLWVYDGATLNEQGFHVYPDDMVTIPTTTGGSMTAQVYYYQVTYEWTDARGNIMRSAPSLPIIADLSGSMTSTNKVAINIPYLRQTYKPNARICIYRWSTAQQVYYQVTSITSPLLNDPTNDGVSYSDTVADSAIAGNLLIYTTGGVVENLPGPACDDITLFKTRLFLINSENKNELWYSKQVIQGTPVEMSDLFTQFVPPSTGVEQSTGDCRTLYPMDDKLIISKSSAFYYMVGVGPDNTGANNDFSDAVFITSSVGTENKSSIGLIPSGLIFQSSNGIWLLDRGLGTKYIGAPVKAFNDNVVTSTTVVPGTYQARLTLDNGEAIIYNYLFDRWNTWDHIPAISSVLYGGLHTYLTAQGTIRQETPGQYLDGDTPVLLSFTSAWINLAGVQGYQRAYFFYLLAEYLTPHTLTLNIAYDYNPSPTQSVTIEPTNYAGLWGDDPYYGQESVWGGSTSLEQWQVFLTQQRCQAFQISLQEHYDPSSGRPAGAGLTLSGLNLVMGMKSGYAPLPNTQQVG